MFVSGPKKIDPGHYVSAGCSTSRAAPIVDAVLISVFGWSTIHALMRTEQDYEGQPLSRGSDIGLSAASTVLFAASTIYGLATVASCRETIHLPEKPTRTQRRSDEAAEEAAVQARAKAKAAADAAESEPIVAPIPP